MAYDAGYDQIPQQETIGVGDVVGGMLNPVNYYTYAHWAWSGKRGQMKIPLLSGNAMTGTARILREYGGGLGNRFVDFMRDKGGLGKIGGKLAGSESIWVGSAPMWSDDTFAITARGASQDAAENLTRRRAAASKFVKKNEQKWWKKETKRLKKKLARTKIYARNVTEHSLNVNTTADYLRDHARMKLTVDGVQSKLSNAMSKAGIKPKPTGNLLERTGERTGRFFRGAWGARSKIAKVGMRATAGMMKGFAYYELAKLAYGMINMAFEPLGRAAISTADSVFSSRGMLGLPEMGGNLKMEYLTRGAATERQRAMQAIQKSRLNARQGMGGEAAMIHR